MLVAITPRFIHLKDKSNFNKFQGVPKPFIDMCSELSIHLISMYSMSNALVRLCDGIILTGSSIDVNPKYYGGKDNGVEIDEYSLDKQLLDYFVANKKPVLGICGGLQALNVYFGGTLKEVYGHNRVEHELSDVSASSFLSEIGVIDGNIVNSFHRLCTDIVGHDLIVSARAKDCTVEALESKDGNCFAVQWHPEEMNDLMFEKLMTYFKHKIEREV